MTANMSITSCCSLGLGDSKSKDLLGFTPSVEALTTIVNNFKAPFTIGVYGDWGSGKTSYMEMLFDELKKDGENYIPIWFNAWKYESEGSVVLPLLSKMSEQWAHNAPVKSKFKSVKKIATAVTLLGADLGIKAVTAGQVSLGNIEASLNKAESYLSDSYDNWVSQCDALEQGFRDLVNTLTNDGEKTIVVFVDDLDRCDPDNVVKLLESIKNYLSLEDCHCLFVMGVDKAVITKGIIAKYGKSLINGDEYLEKIISYSVDVPRPTIDCIEGYVLGTISSQLKPEVLDGISEEASILAKSLSRYGVLNPRRIKRVLPRLIIGLLQEDSKKFLIEGIAYLVLLREYYPDVYASKRNKRSIVFSPEHKAGAGAKDSYDVIKENHGNGWAKLIRGQIDGTYRLSRIQDVDVDTLLSSTGIATEQFITDTLRTIPPKRDKARMINFCDQGIELSPDAYFAKVESLFLLT